jgi:hypothetical protein
VEIVRRTSKMSSKLYHNPPKSQSQAHPNDSWPLG